LLGAELESLDFLGDADRIERAAGELDATSVVLTDAREVVTAGVGRLVPVSWEGTAASAFEQRWAADAAVVAELADVAVRVASILEGLASDLRRARAVAQHAMDIASGAGLHFDRDGRVLAYFSVDRLAMPTTPAQEEERAVAQAAMDSARAIADAARARARAELADVAVPQVGPSPPASGQTESAIAGSADPLADDLGQIGLGGLSVAAGLELIGAGTAGEVGGVGLDATGVGALAGVPINVVGAGAIVAGTGLVAGGAIAAGHGIADIASRAATLFARRQQPPELTAEERQALENRAQGKPYDRRAFNEAQRKVRRAEKYQGERNRQKRESN
jgi:hypothetical protein